MNSAGRTVAGGLLLGILADMLLRTQTAPGLGLSLWIACVALVATRVHARAGGALSAEAKALLWSGVLLAAMIAWRDAAALKLLALAGVGVTFSLPALRAGAAWALRGRPAEYVTALGGAWLHGVAGAVPALAEAEWRRPDDSQRLVWRHAAAATRGVVLAVPFVLVFGSLLIAADAVFASFIADVVRIDFEVLASHAVMTAAFGWLSIGALRGFVHGTQPTLMLPAPLRTARTGVVEGAVLLGLLNALFLAFVVVQFRYLFGGGDMVTVTPDLTYAEYARRGFFELLFVTLLVLPLLLGVDWLLRTAAVPGRSVVRALSGVQIALVLAIAASAYQRMRAYQTAYGMTEDRLYATTLLLLLSGLLVYFALTVLRGRRHAFMPGALVASLATVAALFLLNPDQLIARTNIARLDDPTAVELDGRYLGRLSGDAVPVVLDALPQIPAAARCEVASALLRRFGKEHEDFRGWSWSLDRAERLVRQQSPLLIELAAPCRRADG